MLEQGSWHSLIERGKRIALELPVKATIENQKIAVRLFREARADLPDLEFAELHVTVLYIGRPLELWAEIGRGEADVFLFQLLEMMNHIAQLQWPSEAKVEALDVFDHSGFRSQVALIQPSPPLIRCRAIAWNGLVSALQESGVHDAAERLVTARALNLPSSEWRPHVTLVRRPSDSAAYGCRKKLDWEARLMLDSLRIHP